MTVASFESTGAYGTAFSAFLAADPRTRALRGFRPDSLEEGAARLRDLQQLLFDEGWSRLGWPARCGGLGGDPRFGAAMFEALWQHDILIPEPYNTLEILVPVLLVHAPQLGPSGICRPPRRRPVGPGVLRARRRQRPGVAAHPDGAGRRRLAPHRPEGLVDLRAPCPPVGAARPLRRPGAPGLTMVLVDLDQPGVEVRPIRAQNGENHFAEIFLDGAYAAATG